VHTKNASTPSGENVLVHHQHMLAVHQHQEEEQRKAQEDFNSLFDDEHVFGIPPIGNRSDCHNERTATSHVQKPLRDLFSPMKRKNKDNSPSEGIDKISTNNSTINTQKRFNKHHEAYFEERFNQLLRHKEEFGHCNVPQKYSENPSLGKWCSGMKSMYNNITKGLVQKSSTSVLSKVRRLEQIGFHFRWHASGHAVFFRDNEFGHCYVPARYYKADPSLGVWCKVMRETYRKIQNGVMNHSHTLSQDRIVQLVRSASNGVVPLLPSHSRSVARCRATKIRKK